MRLFKEPLVEPCFKQEVDAAWQVLRWCPRMMAEVQLQAQVAAGGS